MWSSRPRAQIVRAVTVASLLVPLSLALACCGTGTEPAASLDRATSDSGAASLVQPATPEGEGPEGDGATPGSATASSGIDAQDERAGLRTDAVPDKGTGSLTTVPGSVPAPAKARRTVDVAVQIEGGLDVDSA